MDAAHELLPYELLKRLNENCGKRDTLIELASYVGDLAVRGSIELLRTFAALLADYRDLALSPPQRSSDSNAALAACAPAPHYLVLCVSVEIIHTATFT